MHSKMIFVRKSTKGTKSRSSRTGADAADLEVGAAEAEAEAEAGQLSPGWVYVGSANLSESAW